MTRLRTLVAGLLTALIVMVGSLGGTASALVGGYQYPHLFKDVNGRDTITIQGAPGTSHASVRAVAYCKANQFGPYEYLGNVVYNPYETSTAKCPANVPGVIYTMSSWNIIFG